MMWLPPFAKTIKPQIWVPCDVVLVGEAFCFLGYAGKVRKNASTS